MGDPVTGDPVAEARAQGYSNAEIAGHLAGKLGADSSKVQEALDNGYTYKEISDHLAGTPGVDPTRPAQAFFDHIANIAAGGQGAKAVAAFQSIAAGHGMSDYASNLAKTNHDLSAENAANPKTAMAGSLIGGVVSPLNKLVAPLGLLGGAAVIGGLQGSGAAKDDLSSQLIGAGVGAGTSVVGAGLLHTVFSALGPSAGRKLVAAVVAKSPDAEATLAKLVAAGRGEQATLADLGPRLNGVLDRSATRNPDIMDNVQQIVSGRQPDAAGRVLNDFTDAAGNPHAAQLAEQMKQQRLRWAEGPDGFQGLRDKFTALPVGRDLASVLEKPGMKDALEQVKLADKLAGTDISAQIQKQLGSGGLGLTAMAPNPNQQVTYTAAAQLERRLDGMAGKAGSDVALANAYKTLRNGVGDFLASTVPEHAAVKATYHQMLNGEEALAAGAKAWHNPSARDVALEFGALSPAEQTLYRKGLASSVIDHLGSRKTNLNAATDITDASASTQAKLKMIFGDQQTFDNFMEKAQAERTLSRLNSITGGSATARRGADEAIDGAGMAMRGLTSLAHNRGMVSTAVHTFLPAVASGMRNQTALDAGNLLTTQGSDAITQLLSQLRNTNQTMGLLTQGALGGGSAAAGITSGLLSR